MIGSAGLRHVDLEHREGEISFWFESGAVLARIGMHQEGCPRQRVRKWGVFEDVYVWAVLESDFREHAREAVAGSR